MKNAHPHLSAEIGSFHKRQPKVTTSSTALKSQFNFELAGNLLEQIASQCLVFSKPKKRIWRYGESMRRACLRSAINQHCKRCTADTCSPGSWRQQGTLCSVENCSLWQVRPKTAFAISKSVLRWYMAENGDYESFVEAFE